MQESSLEAGPTRAEVAETEEKAEEEEVERLRQFQESGGVFAGQQMMAAQWCTLGKLLIQQRSAVWR